MKHLPIAVALFACVSFGVAVSAATIDFEAQGASAPSSFSGHLDSPLTIGIATFTGGQLLRNESGAVDSSAVYATTNFVSGSYTDPLTITFSQSVSNFSVLITDELPDTYTLIDNKGTTTTAVVSSFNTNQTVSLTDSGITSITIAELTAGGTPPPPQWDFAIDNVSFTAAASVPEPAMLIPIISALLGLLVIRRGRRKTIPVLQ